MPLKTLFVHKYKDKRHNLFIFEADVCTKSTLNKKQVNTKDTPILSVKVLPENKEVDVSLSFCFVFHLHTFSK